MKSFAQDWKIWCANFTLQYTCTIFTCIDYTCLKYCDFMVWTCTEFLILHIEYDQEFIEKELSICNNFWEKIILPELLTRKCESSSQEKSSITNTQIDKKLYCICKTRYDNTRTMFGCNKCDDWFHLECLKMIRGPKTATWYCPSCRKDKKNTSQWMFFICYIHYII